MQNETLSKNCTGLLGVCPICLVAEIFDRYPFDKNKLSGHIVSCCYTIHHDVLRLF